MHHLRAFRFCRRFETWECLPVVFYIFKKWFIYLKIIIQNVLKEYLQRMQCTPKLQISVQLSIKYSELWYQQILKTLVHSGLQTSNQYFSYQKLVAQVLLVVILNNFRLCCNILCKRGYLRGHWSWGKVSVFPSVYWCMVWLNG